MTGERARGAGLAELRLARDGSGVTRVERALARPPLQLSRARYDDPRRPGCPALTLLMLGGVLAGDRNCVSVDLGPGAELRLAHAAATQVLSMPEGDAEQALVVRLAEGARLELLAEPTILFARARYAQRTCVTLAAGSRLALLDVLVPGRLARGELHAFASYRSQVEVFDACGRLLMAERAEAEPARRPPARAGVLRAGPVVGGLYMLGPGLDCERVAAAAGEGGGPLGATTLPGGCGVLVRALGPTPSAVRGLLLAAHARLAAEPSWEA